MLPAAVMAWEYIWLLQWLYCILMGLRWGTLQIERRGGLSTPLLVGHLTWSVLLVGQLTVPHRCLLMVLGLHKTVSTDW